MRSLEYIKENVRSMDGKKVVITGANSGIGFCVMRSMVMKGASIVMASRSIPRMEAAKAEVLKEFPEADISLFPYDQSSLESVDGFVSFLVNSCSDFDGLFLNAGILHPKEESDTIDGFPITVGTNYLGVLRLLDGLMPFLEKTEKRRDIVFEGSLLSRGSHYHGPEKDIFESKSVTFHAYKVSKIGVENLFHECACKRENALISFGLAEPGACKTKIYRGMKKVIQKPADIFMSVAFHSALRGSITASMLLANGYPNGSMLVPNKILRGFPKVFHVGKSTLKYSSILEDGRKAISDIDRKKAAT